MIRNIHINPNLGIYSEIPWIIIGLFLPRAYTVWFFLISKLFDGSFTGVIFQHFPAFVSESEQLLTE